MPADFSPQEFHDAFDDVADIIQEIYQDAEDRRVFPGVSPAEIKTALDEPLPEEGIGISALLDEVRSKVLPFATCNIGPHFYGYITGGGNQTAIFAEAISAAINQNHLKWHSSPISSEMEQLVIRWLAEFIGYPTDCVGALLSGGSVANFEALAVARQAKAPVNISEEGSYNSPPMTVYVSEQGHSSFDKAVDMLGIGRRYLRAIPTDDSYQMRTDLLEQRIREDKAQGFHPICAIGVAGTTNTGAIDDLAAIADICKTHGLWYHVDAAYGGPAAKLETLSLAFQGLAEADSVVINPHKWLYVPFEAGATLYRDRNAVVNTFSFVPDYLRDGGDGRFDQMNLNLPLTKGFKALKVWMTMKAYGANNLQEAIQADIDKAQYLTELIQDHPDLELLAPSPLSIVCFRVNSGRMDEETLDALNSRLVKALEDDGRIFLTETALHGRTALRVCFINHRSQKSHVDRLVEVVTEVAEQIRISTP